MRRCMVTGLFLCLLINPSRSQQAIHGESLSGYIDLFISAGFDELYLGELTDELYKLIEEPVNINSKSREEISRLFFLTEFQVKSLMNYTLRNGPLISLPEISYITGFDRELVNLIRPFILISREDKNYFPRTGRLNVLNSIMFSTRDTSDYRGLPFKSVTRSSYEKGRIKLGLIYEKDIGEKFFYESYKPEFIAGYVRLSFNGVIKKVIIGDFRTRYGQGLAAWQGYSPSSSPLITGQSRELGRIIPYSSSDENNFYRGLALMGKGKEIKFSTYISSNRIDANTFASEEDIIAIQSLYDSGLHNTDNTESKRNSLIEYAAGGNINYHIGKVYIGTSIKANLFSLPFLPAEHIENNFDFNGKINLVLASDYSVSFKRLYLFGESAINESGSFALLQGLRLIPAERVELKIMWSYASRGYTSFHGQVFGKETYNSFFNNYVANINLDIAPGIKLDAGIMKKKDLWYGYRSASFPESIRYIGRLTIESLEYIRITASTWHRQSLKDKEVETGIEYSEYEKNTSARINIEIKPADQIKFVSRAEISLPGNRKGKGTLAYQDFIFRSNSIPLNISTRIYTFSTTSYESRIYTWENDLIYNPSIPVFYGRGFRVTSLIDYGISKSINTRLKLGYSEFKRNNTDYSYFELKFQLRIRL